LTTEYESFIEELKIQCPELPKDDPKDVTNNSGLSTLEEFTKAKFVNFEAKREDLYRLSMDIEAYAVKNYVPLLATFETEALYKYVQKRYTEILEKIPHAWIVGGFDDPFLIPPDSVPATAEILSCLDTNIEKMWIVVTKGPNGPFGLVAEDLGNDKFRGFFTIDSKIIEKVIKIINNTMRIEINFSKE
tara:strand:- start:27 stop:593 length:567 start_codon:yes stop_codon:yes gene_type:complete